MTGAATRQWTSPGPVIAAVMRSMAFIQGVMGPIGGGKTSAALIKMVKLAYMQAPSPIDGIRRFKFCVVRDNYRRLWQTIIPTWWYWVPKETGQWIGATDGPAMHMIEWDVPGVGRVDLIAEFVAIGDNNVEDVLRGYEPTAFLLNEGDRLSYEALTVAAGRSGRWPKMEHGGPSWRGVLMDYNAPDEDNFLFDMMFEHPPENAEFFIQPGGRSPQAENLANLPPGYYEEQVKLALADPQRGEWYVRRYIDNKFGYSREGKPVFPEFNDDLHVAEGLKPIPGLPLGIGLDAGLTPAAAIGQRMPNGQWRILAELVTTAGAKMGPKRFGEALNRLLAERFPGATVKGWADPSAFYGADKEAGEQDWVEIVANVTGITIVPAPTNKIVPRLGAVTGPLTRMIDGETPGFLVDRSCRVLRAGFASKYKYGRIKIAHEDTYTEVPVKNDHSHVADALQYLLLGGGEYDDVMARKSSRRGVEQSHAVMEDEPASSGRPRRGRFGQSFAET